MANRSPLLALPGELRNRIYRLALTDGAPIDFTSRTTASEPALLASNRQIRSETLKIYYSENDFLLHDSPQPCPDVSFSAWLKAISTDNRNLIPRIYVRITPHHLDLKERCTTHPLLQNIAHARSIEFEHYWAFLAVEILREIASTGFDLDKVWVLEEKGECAEHGSECVLAHNAVMKRIIETAKQELKKQ